MTLTRFDIDPKGCMVPRPAGMLVLYDKHAAAAQQDEALIRQMLEALILNNAEWKRLADSGDAGFWIAEELYHYKQTESVISAARARLGEKEGM